MTLGVLISILEKVYENHSGVAQLVEQVAVNHRAVGSSPSSGALFYQPIHFESAFFFLGFDLLAPSVETDGNELHFETLFALLNERASPSYIHVCRCICQTPHRPPFPSALSRFLHLLRKQKSPHHSSHPPRQRPRRRYSVGSIHNGPDIGPSTPSLTAQIQIQLRTPAEIGRKYG